MILTIQKQITRHGVLQSPKQPFRKQNAAFYEVKDRILQAPEYQLVKSGQTLHDDFTDYHKFQFKQVMVCNMAYRRSQAKMQTMRLTAAKIHFSGKYVIYRSF